MAELNKGIIVENISMLMKKREINQSQLAEALGMSQPNISKALNPNDKKMFTIQQIADMAEYFNISVDKLLFENKHYNESITARDIGRILAKLLYDGYAKTKTIEVKEVVFKPFIDDLGHDNCDEFSESQFCPAIYFPNHWEVPDYDPNGENTEYLFAYHCGNESVYKYLNDFIHRYAEILKIYKSGYTLSEDTFNIVLEDLLDHIPPLYEPYQ